MTRGFETQRRPHKKAQNRIDDIGRFVAHISYDRSRLRRRARWRKDDYVWVKDRLHKWYDLLDLRWQRRFPRLGVFLEDPSTVKTAFEQP